MQKSKSRRFIVKVELTREKLKELLDAIAKRSYERGYKDALLGLQRDPDQCVISEKNLCKIK